MDLWIAYIMGIVFGVVIGLTDPWWISLLLGFVGGIVLAELGASRDKQL